jgi:hypothetical protein
MSQHDAAVAVSVHVGMDDATVLGGKRNVLWSGASRQRENRQGSAEDA